MVTACAEPINIILVGLMGSGKTTIGRLLAKKLEWRFIDSDHEIEARTGVRVRTIFELEGEEGFRRREAQVIAELAETPGIILATGGGAVLKEENRHALRKRGWVVYLDVPAQTLYERTRHDTSRPLLRVADPLQKLKELRLQRDPFYREIASYIVDGQRCNSHQAVQRILRAWNEHKAAASPQSTISE